ncbi:hypothetical protein [Actinophytocola oryzae]|uniref:Uncharacterized protein n=1 Tax=Actinophytocola oryzae TaxID=502181 RepID=A0A4R7UWF0_9PSEU|nr:hypothetical protein [Actinophytocola oryzae]TDV41113.1 hypothetical protein CLV71_121179 [Actinophytocola oryzae]
MRDQLSGDTLLHTDFNNQNVLIADGKARPARCHGGFSMPFSWS